MVVVGGGSGAVNVTVDAEVTVVLVGNGAIGFETIPTLVALTGDVGWLVFVGQTPAVTGLGNERLDTTLGPTLFCAKVSVGVGGITLDTDNESISLKQIQNRLLTMNKNTAYYFKLPKVIAFLNRMYWRF